MKFAERVRDILLRNNISQNELAKRAGMSSSGMSTALNESGNPRESTMIQIYDALGMSPEEFWSNGLTSVSLSPKAHDLFDIFERLNDSGQDFLIAQAENILAQPAFRKVGAAKLAK